MAVDKKQKRTEPRQQEPRQQEQRPQEVVKQPGVTKKFFKSFVNVRSWISYDELASGATTLFSALRKIFIRKSNNSIQETYEEAVVRLGLNAQEQTKRKRYFLVFFIVYITLALLLVVHGTRMLFDKHLFATAASFVLAILVFVFAYRESFWYMQMHKHKLGCTFKEWLSFVSGRK